MAGRDGAPRAKAEVPTRMNAATPRQAAQLTEFVKGQRERADPKALGIKLPGGRRARRQGLNQDEMARLMGVSEGWYRRLERGAAPWSERWVELFAKVLKLSTAERLVLYRLALDMTREAVLAISGVPEANRAAIDSFRVPALLLDHAYKVRWRNSAMATLLPELRPGDTLLTWILVSPAARERLADWETDWAVPTLAQLRTAYALTEDHLKPELEVIIDAVLLASPVAHLWQRDQTYYLTPTGEHRRIRTLDAASGVRDEVTVRLWTAQPELYPGWRVYTMEPIGRAASRGRSRSRAI